MPGDTVHAQVFAKYADPNTASWNGTLTTLMANIATAGSGYILDGSAYSMIGSTNLPVTPINHA